MRRGGLATVGPLGSLNRGPALIGSCNEALLAPTLHAPPMLTQTWEHHRAEEGTN